jgi:hypothetical protein
MNSIGRGHFQCIFSVDYKATLYYRILRKVGIQQETILDACVPQLTTAIQNQRGSCFLRQVHEVTRCHKQESIKVYRHRIILYHSCQLHAARNGAQLLRNYVSRDLPGRHMSLCVACASDL